MRLTRALNASFIIGLGAVALAGMPLQRHVGMGHFIGNGIGAARAADVGDATPGEGAFRHLQALQDIATANGGNRAVGTAGYDRSADYFADQLKVAGYTVRFEEFEFPFFEERKPAVLTVGTLDDKQQPLPAGPVRTLSNSGSGDVTAPMLPVHLGLEGIGADTGPPPPSTSGCDAADFQGFARGSVALLRRGTCTFQNKVNNAVAAGAAGVVIMNEGTGGPGRTDAFPGQLTQLAVVPVVGISFAFGRALEAASRDGATVHLVVDAVSGTRRTRNVIADALAGDESPLIVVGAHLDSVPEGPGINDNGSGSAAVLQAALDLAGREGSPKPGPGRRGVQFAFWGAEERGLLGSRHHVTLLSEEERRHIALYINLDMVGSPNFIRFVQRSTAITELSGIAQRALLADFHDRNLPVEERSGGRYGTDDASFYEKGIATVGLYTGAGARKSDAEAALFGGTAGKPYDACYHQACDTIDNIDRELLAENTRALEHALDTVTAAVAATSSQPPAAAPEPKQ